MAIGADEINDKLRKVQGVEPAPKSSTLIDPFKSYAVTTPPPGETLESLRSSLAADVGKTEMAVKQSAQAIGTKPISGIRGAVPRAVKIGQQRVAGAELEQLNTILDQTVEALAQKSGLTDERQLALFKSDLSNRFAKLRMHALRTGIDMDREISRGKLKQSEQEAILNAIGGIAKGVGYGIGSSYGRDRGTGGSALDFNLSPSRNNFENTDTSRDSGGGYYS